MRNPSSPRRRCRPTGPPDSAMASIGLLHGSDPPQPRCLAAIGTLNIFLISSGIRLTLLNLYRDILSYMKAHPQSSDTAMHAACPRCSGAMRITQVTCADCELSLQGDLPTPRLYRLSVDDQRFVELFVCASGSLKQMASLLGVSYPTVRSRLDGLIERLESARAEDEARKAQILDDIDKGRLSPQRGMQMIENL